MKIVDVIPIRRGIKLESLSYFCDVDIEPGSMVVVPLRRQEIPAVVVNVFDPREIKSRLKNSDFQLRNIIRKLDGSFLRKEFLQACIDCAEYYVTTPGNVIAQAVPQIFMDNLLEVAAEPMTHRSGYRVSLIQAPYIDRVSVLRRQIRESMSRGSSVYVAVPTIALAEKFYKDLAKGIERQSYLLHSRMTKNRVMKSTQAVLGSAEPILLVGTASYMCIPRGDLEVICIADEASEYYCRERKPYIDMRKIIEQFAKHLDVPLIRMGRMIRFENIARLHDGSYEELGNVTCRVHHEPKIEFTSLARPDGDPLVSLLNKPVRDPFFAESTRTAIQTQLQLGNNVFIQASRKGMASLLVCDNCLHQFTCAECGGFLALHKGRDLKRSYQCRVCQYRQPPYDSCPECLGHAISLKGQTTGRIAEACTQFNQPLFIVDSDTTTTPKQVKDVVNEISRGGCIVVGTSMFHPYLDHVELAVIPALESCIIATQYDADEKGLKYLLDIQDRVSGSVMIQHYGESVILQLLKQGIWKSFAITSMEMRKRFKYPPMVTMIHIGVPHGVLDDDLERFATMLQEFNPTRKNFRGSQWRTYFSIRLSKDVWDIGSSRIRRSRLYNLLISLPRDFAVRVE